MGIGVLAFIVTLLSSYAFSVANSRLTKRIRKEMITSMVRQEMAWLVFFLLQNKTQNKFNRFSGMIRKKIVRAYCQLG